MQIKTNWIPSVKPTEAVALIGRSLSGAPPFLFLGLTTKKVYASSDGSQWLELVVEEEV